MEASDSDYGYFDEEFVKNNLGFLLEDDSIEKSEKEDTGKCLGQKYFVDFENPNLIYQFAKISTKPKMIWSSNSSGSILSIKEKSSQYVNIIINNDLPLIENLKGKILKETKCQDTDKLINLDSLFVNDLCRDRTSTPKNLPNAENFNKENVNPGKEFQENFCKFCFKNREPDRVYKSHVTKNVQGILKCPILRRHVCDLCGATGDKAHTRKYCPLYHKPETTRPPFRRLANGTQVDCFNHK